MYHVMDDLTGEDSTAFAISPMDNQCVFFVPTGANQDESGRQTVCQQTVAGFLPAGQFEGSHCLAKVWSVRWGPGGLMPVRLVVALTLGCQLKPNECLVLKQ